LRPPNQNVGEDVSPRPPYNRRPCRGVCKNGPEHVFSLKSTLGIVPHLIQGFLGPNPTRERFSRFCTVYSCGVCPMQSNRLTNRDHATCGTCIKTPHLRNEAAQNVWWKIGLSQMGGWMSGLRRRRLFSCSSLYNKPHVSLSNEACEICVLSEFS